MLCNVDNHEGRLLPFVDTSIADHVVGEAILLPGVGYIEMAFVSMHPAALQKLPVLRIRGVHNLALIVLLGLTRLDQVED